MFLVEALSLFEGKSKEVSKEITFKIVLQGT